MIWYNRRVKLILLRLLIIFSSVSFPKICLADFSNNYLTNNTTGIAISMKCDSARTTKWHSDKYMGIFKSASDKQY